ncbi:MAG: sigma-70 family RNA polymerase sigma factor [Bacteroidota bacterium]
MKVNYTRMNTITKGVNQSGKQVYLKVSNAFEDKTDSEVWLAFQQDNPKAFHYIYKNYFTILFNYGCQFTQDKEVVKDLIQDLFIDLNEKKQQLGEVKNIKFYLFKCLKRSILSISKFRHLPQYPNLLQSLKPFAIHVSHEQEIISTETEKAKVDMLNKAYNNLTERQREVLLYYFYEDLNYEEIASLMGFAKTEHARKLVYRAVCKLKEVMQKNKVFLMLTLPLLFLIAAFIFF